MARRRFFRSFIVAVAREKGEIILTIFLRGSSNFGI